MKIFLDAIRRFYRLDSGKAARRFQVVWPWLPGDCKTRTYRRYARQAGQDYRDRPDPGRGTQLDAIRVEVEALSLATHSARPISPKQNIIIFA